MADNHNPLISIIVPVYNTEPYILRCIGSLLRQDFDDYEIVIVNDGTPDAAMDVLEASIHSERIIIRNQKHGGPSSARNEGLKSASGEYVWFVDSDDWLTEHCLKGICSRLDGCDILYFNQFFESNDSADSAILMHNEAETGRELSKNDVIVAPFLFIFRRAFLLGNRLAFPVGLLHEDSLFTPMALYFAQGVKACDTPVYHKYGNPHSITQTINPKRCYDLMEVISRLNTFAHDHVADADRWQWGHFVADSLNSALALSRECDASVKRDLASFVRSNRGLLDYLCHSGKIPTRIMGHLAKRLRLPLVPLYYFLYPFRYQLFKR